MAYLQRPRGGGAAVVGFFFLLEVSSCSCVAFIRDAAPSEKARAFSLSACPVVTSLFDPLASVCRLLFVRMCFCLF